MSMPACFLFPILTPYIFSDEEKLEIEDGLQNSLTWAIGYSKFKTSIRNFLKRAQKGRCAFCRLRIHGGTSFSNLEHLIGKTAYPQFQFNSNNLVYCCTRCNLSKSVQVIISEPVQDLSQQVYPDSSEGFTIINPYFDRYEQHIDFLEDVIITPRNGSAKGRETIARYKLVRTDIAEQRAFELNLDAAELLPKMIGMLTQSLNDELILRQIQLIINEMPNWVLEQ